MADLRTKTMAALRPDAQMRMDNAEANYAADQALQASASSELSKGWTSAGLSERVNQLMWDASTAYKAGDVQTARALEDEGRRTAQVAASWSPEVKNWSDVHDLSSGAKWAMGALGNVRSSVMPALGGLGGAALGGLITRSPEGARWGAALGAGLTGYDQMTNETAGEAMLDPSIRANKTIDQIRDTARVSGAIQAPLEALVPATMGGALLGLGKGAGKQAIKAAVAKEVGREAAGEFGTEFAQDLVGQGAINTLKDRPVTELDYKRALDSAMAGAVAGGGMGLVGGAGHVAHAGLDKTVDTAKDPSNVIERVAAEAGKAVAKAGNKLDDYVNGLNIDPEERAFMAEHHEGEKNLTGEELMAKRRTNADAFAARVLREPQKYGQDEVDMANEYVNNGRNPLNYKAVRDKYLGGKSRSRRFEGVDSELSGVEVKASKMRAAPTDTGFEYGGPVERRQNDPHLMPGRQGQKFSVPPSATENMTDRQENERGLRNAEAEAKKEQVKSEWDRNVDPIADIWRRQGVDEGLLDETHSVKDDDNRRHAIAVIGWTKRGFKTNDGEEVVPTTLIREHGVDNTVRLVKKASDLLVRQGELDPAEAKARLDEMVPKIEAVGKQWKADEEVVFGNLTPIAEQKINDALRGLKEKDKARERSKLVKHFSSIANGEISKEDDEALKSWFGPNANTVLDHFYKEKKSDIASGQDSIDNLNADMAGGFDDEGGNGENVDAHERIINEGSPTAEVVEKSFYVPSKEEHGYFDVEDEGQAAHLQNALAYRGRSLTEQVEKAYKLAKASGRADKLESVRKQIDFLKTHGDTTRVKSEEVGYIDHMLDKAAKKKGSDLTKDEVASIEDKILAKHYGFAGVEEGATNAQKSDHADERKHLLSQLNKKYRTIKVTHSSFGENHIKFNEEDLSSGANGIRMKEPNMLSEAVHAKRGAIVLEMKSGRPFVTTSGQILRKVFQAADNSFEDTKVHMNDIQSRYDLLKQGITSVLEGLEGATGRIGFIHSHLDGADPIWMNPRDVTEHLPDELPLGEVNGVRVTVGDARAADRKQNRDTIKRKYDAKKLDNIAEELSTPNPRKMRYELLSELKKVLENPVGLSVDQVGRLDAFKERLADKSFKPEHKQLRVWFEKYVPGNNTFKKEVMAKQKAAREFLENGELDSMISFYERTIGYNTQAQVHVRQSSKAGRREAGRVARDKVKANIRGKLEKAGAINGLTENQIESSVQEVYNLIRDMSVTGVASKSEAAKDTRSKNDNIVPSEHAPHAGRAVDTEGNELTPNTTLREDRATNVGNSRRANLNRDESGFESGVLATQGMAGPEGDRKQNGDLTKNVLAEPPVAPEAHQDKELAKLKAADLVLAPISVREGYAGNLARWAYAEGKLYTPGKFPDMNGKTLLISVPGRGRGFEGVSALVERAKRAIESGATAITDNGANATRAHNAKGEGVLRQALIDAGYSEKANEFYSSWSKPVKLVEEKKKGEAEQKKIEPADFSAPNVIDGLLRSVGYVVDAARKAAEKSNIDDLVDTLRNISKLNPLQLMKLDGSLTHEAASKIKARAETALSRIEAFQNELPVSTAQKSAQGEVVSVDDEDVRSSDVVPGTAVGSAAVDRARNVAAGVRQGEGVAEGAAAGDVRVKPKTSMVMRFKDGTDFAGIKHVMRDEFRGKSTMDLIMSGDRTATTRNAKPDLQVGDIVTMDDGRGTKVDVRVTKAPYQLKLFGDARDQQNAEKWSRLEGWAPDVFKAYASKGAWQVQYELVAKPSNTKAANKTLSMDSAEVQAAKDHILNTLGSKISLTFVKAFQDGRSGDHRLGPVDQENVIRLALNGDVVGTAYHESIHEFFDMITKHGSQNVKAVLERMGKNKRLLREVSRQLDGHPEAQAQLKDPEEAVAYMYQFWKLGKIKLGPESENLFTKVTNWIKGMLGMISEEMKSEMNLAEAEKILRAFDVGMVKDDKLRSFMLGKLNAEAEQHEAMMRKVGQTYAKFINKVGHLVMPAEQTVEATGNKRLIAELRKFHQKTGEGMGEQSSYFEAVAAKRNQYLNKLETALHKADPKDVELAREHLVKGTEPTDPVVKSIFLTVRSILDDAYRYAVESNVSRWDDKTHEWVVLPKRKNYFPQVWSVETLIEKAEEFQALLLQHHRAELEAIAKESEDANVTAEMVAAEIHNRTINSHGQIEIGESESSLGISPMSAAVNRRSLDWLDKDAFDQFKEKDLVGIMSSYVSGMVKRAEYTKRFGRGGELLRINMDLAFAEELGGEKLVSEAEDLHDEKLKKHYKEKRAKPDMDVEPPRLRDSIVEAFGKMKPGKGKEFILESVKDAVGRLDKASKVVMALEGTLGRDITNNMRTLNSWMMTYQNFRLLSTTLFASFNDTVGLMINGGDMKDAWDGFVRGIREVKLRWGDDKSQDVDALRAEAWGATDAGSFMDSIGQTYGSMYMNGAARRMSDTLFKYNGMEAWNRAMRIQAAKVAERVILKMKTEGVDKHDKAAVARFEDLFGKTFKPEDIKVDANGKLDIKDVKNVAAVNRWVNGAILRPNAAQRPHWASDPHYSMLWHMKQFTYTFQNVILDKVISQAKLGNYRPAMVMMAGYTPVIIAADAVKEMLIPGDEPSWMKSGLAGMLQHGVDKAGLLGIAQLGYDGFAKDYGMNLAGPALSQIGHIPIDDPATTALGALPFGNLARRMAQ